MPTPLPAELMTAFRSMAEVVYSGDSYEAVYESVCKAAVELIDGCDHASLILRDRGRFRTAASSDPTGRHCDSVEQEIGEGPCLDALDDSEPDEHICADLRAGSKWPDLAARLLAETDVHGMAGFRLRKDGRRVGALNVFSDRPGALTERSLDQASLLVAFASVALAAVERGEAAETLRRGLESNREIGKAIGLMMAMHRVDDDEAFAMLSKVSQDLNLKVAVVASEVVNQHRSNAS
ncbi:MAG: hypothetical protein JWR20_2594 [Marmoricola sp.]|nr:hypothetical protein [Marmoricola sp.]